MAYADVDAPTVPWFSCDSSGMQQRQAPLFRHRNSALLTVPSHAVRPVLPLHIPEKGLCLWPLPEQPIPAPTAVSHEPSPSKPPEKEINIQQDVDDTPRPVAPAWSTKSVERKSLYRIISTHDYTSTKEISPRGLLNQSNMCFFNSVLQVLVHCRRFLALLAEIRTYSAPSIKTNTQVLDGLVEFGSQYAMPAVGTRRGILSAEKFYGVICNHPNFKHLQRGRQEDAQEFLGYLLDALEKDFDSALPSEEDQQLGETAYADNESGWVEVGAKGRPLTVRAAGREDYENPVLELFGGRFRSVLKRQNKQPSITLDPFQQIPVDISNPEVNTVQEALDHACAPEQLQLDGQTASKHLEFERLPAVIIVHLKRFTFISHQGVYDFGKIVKPVVVDPLNIRCDGREVRYKPFAIVYHHGPSATMGHYTADVLVGREWFHIDDEHVEPRKAIHASQSAYLVFYEAE